jgi:hypothetical protein
MKQMQHCFDILNERARLSGAKVEASYRTDDAEWMREVIELLGDATIQRVEINRETFAALVQDMRQRYVTGSRRLGEVVLKAGELEDIGRKHEAAEVYRRFIAACPFKFYREIAERKLRDLTSVPGSGD